ncbi:MAG: carbohydrate ABC transporter permease [Candidatus Limnocylindria bacterium]
MQPERLALLALVVVGVPLAIIAYITLAERALGLLSERRRPQVRPWVWIGPAMFFLTLYLIYPSVATIWLSLHDARSEEFVGLANYQAIAGLSDLHIALRNNLLWVVFFTGGVILFGLFFALLADRVRYESAAKSLIFLPMAISFVAAGVIWRFMYAFQPPGLPQTGTMNAVVTSLGADPIFWIGVQPWNNLFLIVIGVWVWTGFAMVILSAALKGIPAELLEAARVDGAGEVRVFRSIILPLLGPTIAVIATTLVIFALKAFDIIYVTTSANFGTHVLATLMYDVLFTERHFGRAGAVAVLLLLAIIPVLMVNLRRFRFQEAIR